MTSGTRAAAAALVLLAGVACARQGAPAGGIQDRVPPVVVLVEPEPFTQVPVGTDELRIRFNERISERPAGGRLEDAIQIVPEVAEVRVSHQRDGLDIKIPGGLRPGVTYTVRLVPVIQDMFGNSMAGPFEWAISTGGTFSENAVVGQIWDRGSGAFLPDMRVSLFREPEAGATDTVRYVVNSGREGLYALRLLPAGDFRVEVFQDRNRNRVMDAGEPRGLSRVALGPTDTVFLSLPVLVPDTTAATLARAEVLDSTLIRVAFDDLLDPGVPLDGVLLSFAADTSSRRAPDPEAPLPEVDPATFPGAVRAFHEWEWLAYRDSATAALDSAFEARVEGILSRGDTVRADSIRSEGPPTVPGASAPPPDGADGILPDGTPVPQPSIVILLDRAVPAGVPLLVRVSGVTNLVGLPGGFGERPIYRELPPPDTAVADTATADTASAAAVPPDTGRVLLFPSAARRR